MIINIQRNELKKTKVYDTYWKFACERQNIFMRKLKGDKFPLTDDLILREYKFTNSYRASDRVSQYLIKNVIYQNEYTEEDAVFRILLFKTFNKIETWKKLESKLGRISYRNFSIDQYGKILKDCYNTGDTLYSGAYIMASGKSVFGQERKFMNHLMLIDYMMKDHVTKKVVECRKLKELYNTYRYGFNEKKEPISKNSALKIFLSHAKDGKNGLHIAKQLKRLIDDSTLTRFFDSNDIAPGYRFDDEIINNIKESSVIIINSDIYSSRYWCQREIQTAKELERPIIEVDLIDEAMDRKFPFAGNVPVIRVNAIEGKVEEEDLYRILENIMLESIRFNYADEKLELLKLKMPGNVKKMCRPPEMIDVSKIIRKNSNKIELKYNKIIYPDPPIYSEEIEFFQKLGIEICTPIEYEKNGLSGKKVGISISDPEINEIKSNGQNESHLLRLSQYMANYILGRGATLIYGGDFRKGGYTEQLLQEAQILKDRLKTKNIYLKNYVAWPIYLADTLETKKWIAKYCDLLEIKEIPIDETVSDLIETNKRFLTPDTVDNCYVWSKSLTKMRYEMIKDCNARICAGGKKIGYKGKMPGILEEIIIASELGCPLYLLGGFGGIVHDVCELLQNNKCTDSLTEEWQVSFNKGYKELLQKYKERDEEIKYLELQEKMKCINLNNGLTMKENEILFNTVYVDEAVQLVLKGLQSI